MKRKICPFIVIRKSYLRKILGQSFIVEIYSKIKYFIISSKDSPTRVSSHESKEWYFIMNLILMQDSLRGGGQILRQNPAERSIVFWNISPYSKSDVSSACFKIPPFFHYKIKAHQSKVAKMGVVEGVVAVKNAIFSQIYLK